MGDAVDEEVRRLRDANKALEEQLRFARQKASLYYIAAAELDVLKRASESFVERIDAQTSTDDLASSCCSFGTQTSEPLSETIEARTSLELAQAECASLRACIDSMKRTEGQRIRASARMVDGEQSAGLMAVYNSLLEEFLKLNKLSINHSIEIKRRDDMISNLFEKIRTIEMAFAKKLEVTERIADTRQQVIQELGQQVKEAITKPRTDWNEIGALHAEMEDLRAELSMARSNWIATREELARLQFRVGQDGNGGDVSPQQIAKYPNPVVQLVEQSTGLISDIRSIRISKQS
jgi:hypothetical protein